MLISIKEALPESDNQAWMDGFERELRLGFELEKAQYKARQMAIREQEKGVGRKMFDGIGQVTGIIDARTYFRWQQEDPDFWNDDGNYRKFLRDNPECRAEAPDKKPIITL